MSTSSKSEDLLALLLWGLDLLTRPTPYNILRGFEAWDYENRIRPQLRRLERARMLERQGSGSAATIRLTPQGQTAAFGGVDPLKRWQRRWDGKWRLLLFDLPSGQQRLRLRLWRWLRTERLGFLQNSVWTSPDALDESCLPLKRLHLTPESFTVFIGQPVPPDTDADFVQSAWDFVAINRRYQSAMNVMERGRDFAVQGDAKPAQFHQWLKAEREAWAAAITIDPLLPEPLLPPGYLGREAWKLRQSVFAALAKHRANG